MLQVPSKVGDHFDTVMESTEVDGHLRPHYRKWLRFYLDFCAKYGFDSTDKSSFRHFNAKLRAKGQTEWKRRQARQGVVLYFQVLAGIGAERADQYEVSDEPVVSAGALKVPPPGGERVAASIPVDGIREEQVVRNFEGSLTFHGTP